jgi:DNA (cytosine-5)-methyltransferase 1
VNVLSLFAGIGGFELGLERAGMSTVGQVEINPFCRRVLAKHWPEVARHDDVRTTVDWWQSQTRPDVDLICGGFPCQDISSANTAGPRAGLSGAKSGLWTAYAATLEVIRPQWVIVENSPRWRTWAPTVRADLYNLGYGSCALELPAGALGAPHRRPRCVVVAHANGDREPLRALHAQMAQLRPIPRRSGHWAARGGLVGMGDGLPGQVDRLRALGNAIVPQVSELVGRLILTTVAEMGVAT